MRRRPYHGLSCVGILLALAACSADPADAGPIAPPTEPPVDTLMPTRDTVTPLLDRSVWLSGLSNPWDIAFLPNGDALITERNGRLSRRSASGTLTTVAQIADVVVSGEGGLLGMTIDPAFATNRVVYACLSSNRVAGNDNRVSRWRLADDGASLENRTDIVTGLPWANGGRHSACRPRFGPDGLLYISTGDAAVGANPQRLTGLGGKVLRVTRDGAAAANPAIVVGGVTADPRIFTYGHRNPQGLGFRPSDGAVYTIEQGPAFDDEVTRLTGGRNAGWNPVPGYNEAVSMTDLAQYPDAMRPLWRSGAPAQGTSGGTFIRGDNWRGWNGALVIAQLAGTKLVVLTLNTDGSLRSTTNRFAELNTRLRVPVIGPDSALYVATDVGGGGGQIWRITPRSP